MLFLTIWVLGYVKQINKHEYLKESWFKKDIVITNNQLKKNTILDITIPKSAKNPSLRKVIMLSEKKPDSKIARNFYIKVKKSEHNVWVLLRNIDTDNNKVWVNATTGEIGEIEGNITIDVKKDIDGFLLFTYSNQISENTTREWFYVTFVDNNKSYQRSKEYTENIKLQLKEPKAFLNTEYDLLKTKPIYHYNITQFNKLGNYAHATYFGFIFLFACVVFMFNKFFKTWVQIIAIFFNIVVLISFGSKAIIISLFLVFPIFLIYLKVKKKIVFMLIILTSFLIFTNQINQRFNQMYQTILKVNQDKKLDDLKTLSTYNRMLIYENYVDLIKSNFITGYGFKNGKNQVKNQYNYNFNAHNQYLQSTFNAGVIGLISLLYFCLYPFFTKVKKKKENFIFLILISLILFNFFFESLLFRQWGLIIVSFIYALYYQFNFKELKWYR